MNWFGWIFSPARKWERVTGPHDSLSACSRALTVIGDQRGVPDRLQAMTGGFVPTFVPAWLRTEYGKSNHGEKSTV